MSAVEAIAGTADAFAAARRWRGRARRKHRAGRCDRRARRRHAQDAARRVPRRRNAASIRRRSATPIPMPCASASSIRSIATIISRDPSCWCRTPPTACPQITDGGRTYTIKVKRGIYFAADPAFNGKRRELTAEDYVYSIKRVFDPKVRSYWLYLFEQTLVGLDGPARARAQDQASSTTTKRSRVCRRSTATRCASASSSRITRSSGG